MKVVVGIGPELDRPTWSWVGFNLMRELSRYFDLAIFRGSALPECDVLLSIKEPVRPGYWDRNPKAKVVYMPCDYYQNDEQMRADASLPRYSAILSQSELFSERVRPLNANVFHVEHDSKYVLPEINPYRENGFILWVGFSSYLELLRNWLVKNPLPRKLVILTDRPNDYFVPGSVVQLRWTPRMQYDLFKEASAALDVKGADFLQTNKPPEKLQTFIASGIPAACNPESPVADYFHSHGFKIVTPSDTARWFSREYYDETVEYAHRLRATMDLKSIGEKIKTIIEGLV